MLLSEVVMREMAGCGVMLIYDTSDTLMPLPSALLQHPYGLSFIYLPLIDAASALSLKVKHHKRLDELCYNNLVVFLAVVNALGTRFKVLFINFLISL